ncbi:hypothetical protein K458DRAFT_416767 [Lentithecium fluviatile CBS 122367]|uniref:Secreted protein n=1 Tax=Lentithecium fluviatile CBS 122367 TaxID=1168545 RepID=A0A6G1J5L8_9PLEO|nr:hypothetical protein K458DRAFT_416767 [Lentithecium fluviatile CBS 122367]
MAGEWLFFVFIPSCLVLPPQNFFRVCYTTFLFHLIESPYSHIWEVFISQPKVQDTNTAQHHTRSRQANAHTSTHTPRLIQNAIATGHYATPIP